MAERVTPDANRTLDPYERARRERRRRARARRARRRGLFRLAVLIAGIATVVVVLVSGLGGGSSSPEGTQGGGADGKASQARSRFSVPPLVDPSDVYAATRPGMLAPAVKHFPARVYVPNSESDTVSVINPRTFRVIDQFPVGINPQHVVPSYDLKTLWVDNDQGNSLTPINPATGKPGRTIPVSDPYNLYFTPDGRYAIVVAERLARLDFRDAHTMRLHRSVPVPCEGPNHMDFSADGRYLLASCEFGDGRLVKVDVRREKVVGTLGLPPGASPQDVRLSPDGKIFYVADLELDGVWVIDARKLRRRGFIPTGAAAHGLYPSLDSRYLYVSNRDEGSVSVISFSARKVVRKWRIPGGGSPDMGGVSPDGKVLWLGGRFDAVVYAISTRNGRLLTRIPVGSGPHGVCVYPLSGRYSLGHTDNMR